MSFAKRSAAQSDIKLGAIPRQLSPANYQIGSAKSRLALKFWLESKRRAAAPTPDEQDYIDLYRFIYGPWVNYGIDPGRDPLIGTEAYQRGRAIALAVAPNEEKYDREEERRRGPARYYQNAVSEFMCVYHRMPSPGDKLTREEARHGGLLLDTIYLMHIHAAWKKKLPLLPFPYSWSENPLCIWQRVKPNSEDAFQVTNESGTWEKRRDFSRIAWELMQQQVCGGIEDREYGDGELFPFVVFGDGVLLAPAQT